MHVDNLVAATAIRLIFASSTPDGQGPLDSHCLYRQWTRTGLRRDDLAEGLIFLHDHRLLRDEQRQGRVLYFLSPTVCKQGARLACHQVQPLHPDRPLEEASARADHAAPDIRFGRRAQDARRPPVHPAIRRVLHGRFLGHLPGKEREALLSAAELVPMPAQRVLCDRGHPIGDVYLPLNCLLSVRLDMSDGATLEVGIVGSEGLAGAWVLTGDDHAPYRVVTEVSGYAYRLPSAVLIDAFQRFCAFQNQILRYMVSFEVALAFGASCNHHHSIRQRICRLLLSAADRIGTDSISLTHQEIAECIGVRREGVTQMLGTLEKSGLVARERGCVRICDRAALETQVCECYAAIRAESEYPPARNSVTHLLLFA